jgi:ATP-dependent helicase/nuclease subunit A
MPKFPLTPQQQRAVTTVGQSLIVSAAAGSGKTSVLAERCAYLVCDAPPPARCDVDRLLVLTFTEAAAGEMRQRIVAALRDRSAAAPGDRRLREQVALADAARISTIHAFCLWVIRRHFSEAEVDPSAPLLDEHEAAMVRRDVLDEVIRRLYAAAGRGEPGAVEAAGGSEGESADLGRRFVELVDAYGLGEDRGITEFVHRLALFLESLPDPEHWLAESLARLGERREALLAEVAVGLVDELAAQIEHLEALADRVEAGPPEALFYAERLRELADQYDVWLQDLAAVRREDLPLAERLACYEAVREKLAAFEPNPLRKPNLPKGTDAALKDEVAALGKLWSDAKQRLWGERVHDAYALFSLAQWRDGLDRIAPFAATLGEMAGLFRTAYAERKRRLGALDFSDLERFALRVLREPTAGLTPSPAARALQRKFDHVLVDEFQDVSPIQDAIIRLVSREGDGDRDDNLFVVGDVKQSIYRFRLAEPGIFLERLHRFAHGSASGSVVTLPDNFRSRAEILDAANILFRAIMHESLGGIAYDKDAELSPGRKSEAEAPRPIELHLLERQFRGGRSHAAAAEPDATDEPDAEDGNDADPGERHGGADDPAAWAGIEREAYLIGLRIAALLREEKRPDGSPWRYSDVAILLRATSVAAEMVATVLTRMGIPAHADAGGSLMAAVEIRDVLAALRVFDNPRQDIALAAVMRSGLIAPAFSDDDLVAIRCHDRGIPFHEAVMASAGPVDPVAPPADTGDLPIRVRAFLDTVDRWRGLFRRRPLPEALGALYEETALLAQVGGLPGGAQRRANLLRLHDLARQFAAFRIQGLHRFLRFVDSLDEREQRVDRPSALGEAEDVVRILSIHRSKGLEFPIVFVAGLGTKFNLADRNGRMIFERRTGIGLRVVEPERLVEYESCARMLAAGEVERQSRAEELRILYVALTRARERLILVGSVNQPGDRVQRELAVPRARCGTLALTLAATPLDWILPALTTAAPGCVAVVGRTAPPGEPRFSITTYERDAMADWRIEPPAAEDDRALHAALAEAAVLPEGEPLAGPRDAVVGEVLARLGYVYPHLAAAGVRASAGASQLKGMLDIWTDPEERRPVPPAEAFVVPPSRYGGDAKSGSLLRGTVTHRLLQHLDLAAARDRTGAEAELRRLTAAGLMSDADAELVDFDALAWFLGTPLAERLRAAGPAYRREFAFATREPVGVFLGDASAAADVAAPPTGDTVLVRGIVDGILVAADGLELVDFKTDNVAAGVVDERAAVYRTQMILYGRAMARLFDRPVRACRLVFLSARRIVDVRL